LFRQVGGSRWTRALVVLSIAVGVGLWFGFDMRGVLRRLQWNHVFALAAVQPIQWLALWVVTFRFSVLARQPRTPLWITHKAYLLSIGLNTVIPGRLSELLKLSYMSQHTDCRYSQLTSALVLERFSDVLLLGCFLAAGLGGLWVDANPLVIVAAMAGAVLLFLSLPFLRPVMLLLSRVIPSERLRHFVCQTYDLLGASIRTSRFWLAAGIGFFAWASILLLVYAVLQIVGREASLEIALAVYAAIAVGRAIPALPASLGTYEAAAVVALRQFGYPFEEALTVALTMHMSQLLLPTTFALGLLIRERTGLSSLLSTARRKSDGSIDSELNDNSTEVSGKRRAA
jgi:uncharacterized membrane protein YbhN (UPF0104 family)